MIQTINTAKCAKECVHGCNNNISKAVIKVHCACDDKDYPYGTRIQCDNFERKKNDED